MVSLLKTKQLPPDFHQFSRAAGPKRQLRPRIPLVRFMPEIQHGSGIGDYEHGGGRCPEKESDPTPLGRLSSVRQPGRAKLNLT
jgi:hypothetical protein